MNRIRMALPNLWESYARFLKGTFMHVERSPGRGIPIGKKNDKPIIVPSPNNVPKFQADTAEEKNEIEKEFRVLMSTPALWTKYTGSFAKAGEKPEAPKVETVFRGLWLKPSIEFKPFVAGSAKEEINKMKLFESMPFSTSSTYQAAFDFLSIMALRAEGTIPHIFRIHLRENKDAYIDALAAYDSHTADFFKVGFDARPQLLQQKEITMYPGVFFVSAVTEVDQEIKGVLHKMKVVDVHRIGTAWIIEKGGLAGGRRLGKKRKTQKIRKLKKC